jgi:diadenosine tetraphosphate (Ap4A) HIT family hydrolase
MYLTQHLHIHVLPRKPADFPENDDIYKELAGHDKGKDIAWRSEQEMREECEGMRAFIRRNAYLLDNEFRLQL